MLLVKIPLRMEDSISGGCPKCTRQTGLYDYGDYISCLYCGWIEEKGGETVPLPPSPESWDGEPWIEVSKDDFTSIHEGRAGNQIHPPHMKVFEAIASLRKLYASPDICVEPDCQVPPQNKYIHCRKHQTMYNKLWKGCADVAWREMALRERFGIIRVHYINYYISRKIGWRRAAQWVEVKPENEPLISFTAYCDFKRQMVSQIGKVKWLEDAIAASNLKGWEKGNIVSHEEVSSD